VTRLDAASTGRRAGCSSTLSVSGRSASRPGRARAAIRGAKARPLVDRWAWSRTKSTVDISPLVASTLALWSAVEHDLANGGLAIF
jgi:hypothetical protein